MRATRIGPRSLSSVGVAFGVLLIAIFVFLVAGAYESFGPLDLDTADRLAVALWVAAPIAGGLVARGAATGALIRAALGVGIPVGLVVALLPLAGTGQYTCWLTSQPCRWAISSDALPSVGSRGSAWSPGSWPRGSRPEDSSRPYHDDDGKRPPPWRPNGGAHSGPSAPATRRGAVG